MNSKLAYYGGTPTREKKLLYGFQTIDELDKQAVMDVLDENIFLTTGPKVTEFENKIKEYCNIDYAVAVNSGTAALHIAIASLGLEKGDEIIVPTISFVATSNAVLYCNCNPIFCDIDPETMNIDDNKIEALITKKTKAIVCVDFAGQPCKYNKISMICKKHNLYLIEDAAHSIGTYINNDDKIKIGAFADVTTFSFHPVKSITTGEGGMAVTNNKKLYDKMKFFGKHGITKDFKTRETTATHYYEMIELGFNYRIPDILCALGISQLKKLDSFIHRRREIASIYDNKFSLFKNLFTPLKHKYKSARHIYVIKLHLNNLTCDRDTIFKALTAEGIGVNVHYMPIHLHPYYIKNVNTYIGLCPVAEQVYKEIITLPLFPLMTERDINDVINAVVKVVTYFKI